MTPRKKTGGRKAGTPNLITADIKSRIAALIDEQFDSISADMAALEPKDRIAAYQRFIEYVLPKQREQKIDLPARIAVPEATLTDEQRAALVALNRQLRANSGGGPK